MLVLLLGSNIGNFDTPAAHEFLRAHPRARSRPATRCCSAPIWSKPERDLQLAYDDPLGVTAAFNRNLLVRINRELGGDVRPRRLRARRGLEPGAPADRDAPREPREQTVRIAPPAAVGPVRARRADLDGELVQVRRRRRSKRWGCRRDSP